MASTISYAKIVRNQKDEQIEPSDEKSPEGRKTKCQESLIKSQSPEIDDQSFKEVSSVKKVKNQQIPSKKKQGSNNRRRRKANDNTNKQSQKQHHSDTSNNNSSPLGKEKSESGKTSPANVTDASEPKVKYVEAPIPKTNPWKKVDPTVNDVITIKPETVENDDINSSNEETAKIIGGKDSNGESKFIKTVKSTSKALDTLQTVEDIKQLSNQSEKEVFSKTEKKFSCSYGLFKEDYIRRKLNFFFDEYCLANNC